ncbi:hypothetical protein NBRC10512v2_003669, partial [Rhodotorula toruloides]
LQGCRAEAHLRRDRRLGPAFEDGRRGQDRRTHPSLGQGSVGGHRLYLPSPQHLSPPRLPRL